jgi:hypothetical protein
VESELLSGEVGLEGVSDLPLLVVGFGRGLGAVVEGGVAGGVEPAVELGEDVVCEGRGVEGGVAEGVEDEAVLAEERVGEGEYFLLENLAVPLLEDVDEEAELLVRAEQRVAEELPQLEAGVLLAAEELGDVGLHRLAGVVQQDGLQRGAPLFHSKR